MKAVVAGMIGTFPVGGVVWDYGQYALALERLGFDVFYLEDNGCWNLDADAGLYEESGAHAGRFLADALPELSSGLRDRWHFRAADGSTYGVTAEEAAAAVADADVFLNVSAATQLRDEHLACPHKILIDTDPGWNHFSVLPRHDVTPPAPGFRSFREHDAFFTYALAIGRPGCELPDLGIDWRTTVPPVALDRWSPDPPASSWTSVLTWDNYGEPIVVDGRCYGSKADELAKIVDLPAMTGAPLELAMGGARPPVAMFEQRGWRVVDGPAVTRTAAEYRDYVRRSRGEVSVAKNIYVATGSGWFSCRSVCYLASGRPVVVQDTGFADHLPTGKGLLTFTSVEQAAAAVRAVEADYDDHAAAARAVAEETFDAETVLERLLDQAGVR